MLCFVDSSVLITVAFEQPGWEALRQQLASADQLLASPLLEAECRAVARREERPFPELLLSWICWVYPGRPLSNEIERVLAAGYVRGADCWHLATALHLAPDPTALLFLTRDLAQREVAQRLGFAT